jgi:hypothetical protein
MDRRTLYMELGRELDGQMARDRGRTEWTAAKETIDNDHSPLSLYTAISGFAADGSDRGRTEETKAGGETVDRDRHMPSEFSAVHGADLDLYAALGSNAAPRDDSGRTAITESTETLDWDRSPVGPWT